MEICSDHLTLLERGLKLRGLSHLRVTNEEDAQAVVRAFNGEPDEDDDPELFDALLAAQLTLFQKAMENGGAYLLEPNDANTLACPLCALQAQSNGAIDWINGVSDHIRQVALKYGLVKPETRQ